MKLVHWIALLGVGYFAVTGINEFLPSGTVSALDGLPDFGSVLSGSASTTGTNAIAGAADLATAIAIYSLVLHKPLFG